ncbi:MAG TPA: YjbQ family protein, partial [Mariniflexile sp.]|nr:YjbQ family protein [Mariniflexile sp.]
MKCFQKQLKLKPYARGFHLITDTILNAIPEIGQIQMGQLQVFIKHTSTSLTINENADFTVR